MGAGREIGRRAAPRVVDVAPGLTTSFVREALRRAIEGFGPFAPASAAAQRQLREHDGDVEAAVEAVVDDHVRYAGAQGLLTNVGGLVTMTVTLPTNITGLAVVQCRMVAAVAHLRGYDLDDARVRTAVLATVLGEDRVDELVRKRRLAGPPMALATAHVADEHHDSVVANEVARDLVTRVAGRRLATTLGRRMPVIGGIVGMGADGWSTWKVGRYAERELRPRARR